jgi:hypothetical protein
MLRVWVYVVFSIIWSLMLGAICASIIILMK